MKRVFISIIVILGIFFIGLVFAQNQALDDGANSSANTSAVMNKSQKNNSDNSAVVKITTDKIEFVPFQKRNDSECLEGCNCTGAVVSCKTENGKILTITAGSSGNLLIITIDNVKIMTELELEQETKNNMSILRAKLSNGKKTEIKIMPDSASEKAIERLKLVNCLEENGCTIELKETGRGEDKEVVYEVNAEKRARILGLFNARMMIQAHVSAETGEIIFSKKPWWAFIAAES